MGRKSEKVLKEYRDKRQKDKALAKRWHSRVKGDRTLEILVHQHQLLSVEELRGWKVEHTSGFCRGVAAGCPYCIK